MGLKTTLLSIEHMINMISGSIAKFQDYTCVFYRK
jgi:hypothetical protein